MTYNQTVQSQSDVTWSQPSRLGQHPARGHRWRYGHKGRGVLALALPSVVVLLGINVYPLLYAVFQSVHNGTLITSGNFIGGQNYSTVLTSGDFWHAVAFSAVFVVAGVGGSYVVGMVLALMLRNVPGAIVFRVLLLLPWVVPIVVSMTSWDWLIGTRGGLADTTLHALGLPQVLFLASPNAAIATVCVVKIWESFPFMMLVLGAGLEGIDPRLLEAAAVDGCGPWQRYRYITFPILRNISVVSWILMAIFCVNDFATIWLLTGGGPLTSTQNLIVYSYQLVFNQLQTGIGIVVAILTTIIMSIFSLWLFILLRRTGAERSRVGRPKTIA
jgi:multiple sugar transport system permease protein